MAMSITPQDDDFHMPDETAAEMPTAVEPAEQEKPKYPEINSLAGFLTDGPATIDLKNLPPAPLHIFSDGVREVITETGEAKNVPPEAPLTALLSLVSASVERARGLIYRPEWREFANLYFMLIAETGAGKSHLIDYIFKDLSRLEADKKAEYKILWKKYLDDCAAAKKDKDTPIPQRPLDIQYLLDDATMEAALGALEDNPRGLFWLVDEFAGFFGGLGRYNKNDGGESKKKLLSAFDGKTVRINRKPKDGIPQNGYLSRATFGMLGGIQPHLLKSAFSYDDVKQGWPQRFLYCRAVIDKPMRLPAPEISEKTAKLICRITERLVGLGMTVNDKGQNETVYLKLEPDAVAEFENFVNTIADRSFDTEAFGYTAKMNRMLLRLALILELLEWAAGPEGAPEPTVVTYDTMNNAITLLAWFANHTEAVRQYLPTCDPEDVKKQQREDKRQSDQDKLRDFIEQNSEWCSEWRTAGEILKKMGKPAITAIAFGKRLKNLGFTWKSEQNIGLYQLYPIPGR